MDFIRSNGHTLGADDDDYTFSWDDKRPGTKILLSKEFLEKSSEEFQLYKTHADNYICSLVPGTPGFQAQYTPGGLIYKGSESNLQYVTSTAFLLLTYAKYLNSNGGAVSCGSSRVTEQNIIKLAKTQVDYILGNNPTKMSYMVGFGERYPKHIHHRGSSLSSIHSQAQRISCNDGFQYLSSGAPNPNVLVGAIQLNMGRRRKLITVRDSRVQSNEVRDSREQSNDSSDAFGSASKKKTRGYTHMLDVWDMPDGELVCVETDGFGNPIGWEGKTLLNAIGSLVRRHQCAPINYVSWKDMPESYITNMFDLIQEISRINKRNRSKYEDLHCMGSKNLPRLINEMTIEAGGVQPSRTQIYIDTRTRKDGSIVTEKAASVIDELKKHMEEEASSGNAQTTQECTNWKNDIFSKVKGRVRRGRVHCLGKISQRGSSKSNGDGRVNKLENMMYYHNN